MIKIAICDDAKSEQERLKSLLLKTGLFDSAEFYLFNSLEFINSYDRGESYDFVFLDVDMREINGIEAAKRINSANPDAIIIFVSNCLQYAIEAFDCNAFHYLLKDSTYEKFCSVISKAFERYKLLRKSMLISTKEGQINLKLSDIYYVEHFQKHLYFYTESEHYVMKGTISQTNDILSPLGFYQVHQGYIVNFGKVASITDTDVILQNGVKVMVSVRKKKEVLKAYSNYIAKLT